MEDEGYSGTFYMMLIIGFMLGFLIGLALVGVAGGV